MTLFCETFIEQIDESLNILDLSLRLQIGFREKHISKSCLESKIGINNDTDSYLPSNFISDDSLKNQFRNLVLSALCTASCAIDRALDDKFGKENKKDSAIRNVFYMIRCAFAHDPINPKWKCNSIYCEKPYIIEINKNVSSRVIFSKTCPEKIKFEFNFKELNGQSLKLENFFALDGFFLLAEYAKKKDQIN